VMNQSKKLELSKETLRCLDDQDLTDVAGGTGGGGRNNNTGICVSAQQGNSCVCGQSVVCHSGILCFD